MAETKLNLVQKLAKMREMVEVLRKNKAGYNYKYVTEDEIMAKVAAGMKKYDVSLIPSIVQGTLVVTPCHYEKTKITKSGEVIKEAINEVLVYGEMLFTWVNNEDRSDHIQVPWVLVGRQSDASQTLGSALTYANRYFMLKYFQIATPDDDPDNWRGKKEEASQEADRAAVQQVITKIDAYIRGYIDANGDNVDEARKNIAGVVKKYVRNGAKATVDYQTHLTDMETAGKLLEALQNEFKFSNEEGEK